MQDLRNRLVEAALQWERAFGNAPSITSALSEYDASTLVGCPIEAYSTSMQGMTSVQRGHDFIFCGKKYQVKGNRPSGKPGSKVTWVPKATNYEWDFLIWILYNPKYEIQEAWLWDVARYVAAFETVKRLSPSHLRQGTQLA
jgi:hypothetical protein